MKKKQISYSAPVCVVLVGDESSDVPNFGKPFLMASDNQRVMVTLNTKEGERMEPFVKELCEALFATVTSDKPLPHFHVTSERELSTRGAQAACIVAFVACYLEYIHSKPPTKDHIQKVAYILEKKLFKNHSHGQTVTSVQGGLIFYRKEFDFYKTVVQIPAKFSEEFVKWLSTSPDPLKNETLDTDLYIRRLIFSIMHENLKLFQEVWVGPNGFIPSIQGIKQE